MPLAKAISYSTNIKAELKKQKLSKVKKGNKQAKKVTAKKPETKTKQTASLCPQWSGFLFSKR